MAIAPGTPPHGLVQAMTDRAVLPAMVTAANASAVAQRARAAATPNPNELLAALRALAAARAQAPGQQYEGGAEQMAALPRQVPVAAAPPSVPQASTSPVQPIGVPNPNFHPHPLPQPIGVPNPNFHPHPDTAAPDPLHPIRNALLHAFMTGELVRGKGAR